MARTPWWLPLDGGSLRRGARRGRVVAAKRAGRAGLAGRSSASPTPASSVLCFVPPEGFRPRAGRRIGNGVRGSRLGRGDLGPGSIQEGFFPARAILPGASRERSSARPVGAVILEVWSVPDLGFRAALVRFRGEGTGPSPRVTAARIGRAAGLGRK